MNQGQFGDMMAAFEGLMQRLDKLIVIMEEQHVNWNSMPEPVESPKGYGGRKSGKDKDKDK